MAQLEQDYYEVLGVNRSASDEEIKRAFRQLARRLHPDVAEEPAAEGAFHEVAAAYEVLSHPRRRLLYDRFGFGSRRPPAPRAQPAVPPIDLHLEWYEAERGASKPVEYEQQIACRSCGGKGAARGVTPATCVVCRGAGRLSTLNETPSVRLLEVRKCTACEGRGHAPVPACEDCAGSGSTRATRSVRVRTPAGVRDGDLLRVDGITPRFLLRVGTRPRDSKFVLGVAAAALLCALGLLLFLLFH